MKTNALSIIPLMVAALAGGAFQYVFRATGTAQALRSSTAVTRVPNIAPCGYVMSRVAGYQRVSPLLTAERECESPRFQPLRSALGSLIDGLKSSGELTSASVYIFDLQQGDWAGYNATDRYDPGSMMKVPLMLSYLSMAEEIPDMLQRTWTCDPIVMEAPEQSIIPEKRAEPNVSYTVAQLLELMMVYSDNRATAVLLQHVPSGRFVRTFTDLGLPAPVQHAGTYMMNARDYSVFMKALYHSSLLSPMRSDHALDLMSRSTWGGGLLAGLPADVEVAHKFGEAVDQGGFQLHETGLVYAEDSPYIVTVMTRGTQAGVLAGAISRISRIVYEEMTRDSGGQNVAQRSDARATGSRSPGEPL